MWPFGRHPKFNGEVTFIMPTISGGYAPPRKSTMRVTLEVDTAYMHPAPGTAAMLTWTPYSGGSYQLAGRVIGSDVNLEERRAFGEFGYGRRARDHA